MIKILVVDDDPVCMGIIRHTLESVGSYEVMTVSQARQAISAVRKFQPALVILDVMMPDILGTEIAEQISQDKNLRHVKVIFVTAMRTKEEELAQGEFFGGQHIIAKPVVPEELLKVIQKVLA